MISTKTLERIAKYRKAVPCTPLAGNQFGISVTYGGTEATEFLTGGTVTIEPDLSYTTSEGDSGQLTQRPPGERYTYHEDGPVIDGSLWCENGVWWFMDSGAMTNAFGFLSPIV